MQAISSEALPLPATPKGVTTFYIGNELAFIYVKRANAKNSVISYLRVPRVRNGQMQAISCQALPLPATPKGVTTYRQRNWLLFMLKGPRLKTVSYGTLGFPEYGMANACNFIRGFTPASNPKGVTTYGQPNWFLFMLKGPRLKPVSYRTLGFSEYEMTNAINLKCAFTPASNPKRGAKHYHVYHWPSSEYLAPLHTFY